jgi:hypothetical protein
VQTFANPLFLDNNYQWMFGFAGERGEMEMAQTERARVEIKQGEQSAFPLFERLALREKLVFEIMRHVWV